MHHFHYHPNGTLHCEDVDLHALAQEHGTPLYVYSKATLLDHYRRLDQALAGLDDHRICYAVKANSNIAVLNLLANEGSGFDIVSGGELHRVIQATAPDSRQTPAPTTQAPPAGARNASGSNGTLGASGSSGTLASGANGTLVTFAGVGKTRDEIEFAIREGIYCFNVESEAEINHISDIAGETFGMKAPIAIRVNPNVDAKTHKYISTGKSENKFGIDFELVRDVYARAAELPFIQLRGVQMHIGSQLTSLGPFVEAIEKMIPLVEELRDAHGIEFYSIGGGIGIVYEDSLPSGSPDWWHTKAAADESPLTIDAYARAIVPLLKPLGLRILLEPGRMIAGNAGVLLTQVLYEKKGAAKTFEIVDAGMNDLIRPALYQGHHDIVPVTNSASKQGEASGSKVTLVDVVGPICESGDFFAQDRPLPPIHEGQYLALMSAGAYGFTMASNYNTRPFPAEILVDGATTHVIRRRQSPEDLTRDESIPQM